MHAQAFNAVIARMVTAVLWTSPLGVASLIAAALCHSCNLGATAAALGLWVLVVSPILVADAWLCLLSADFTFGTSVSQTGAAALQCTSQFKPIPARLNVFSSKQASPFSRALLSMRPDLPMLSQTLPDK